MQDTTNRKQYLDDYTERYLFFKLFSLIDTYSCKRVEMRFQLFAY